MRNHASSSSTARRAVQRAPSRSLGQLRWSCASVSPSEYFYTPMTSDKLRLVFSPNAAERAPPILSFRNLRLFHRHDHSYGATASLGAVSPGRRPPLPPRPFPFAPSCRAPTFLPRRVVNAVRRAVAEASSGSAAMIGGGG